jgi:hypothetical protein
VIALYAQDKAPETARPRATAARLQRLADFFKGKSVAYVTPTSCRAFAEWWGSEQAARRALESAGIEFIAENGGGTGVRLRKK